MFNQHPEDPEGDIVIYRASRNNPHTGIKEYAKDFGLKAFRIVVRKRRKGKKEE